MFADPSLFCLHTGTTYNSFMANCTKCNTWNPDDKNFCWRCGAELPKPVAPKPKRAPRTFVGVPIWMWLAMILFFAMLFLGQCFVAGMTPT